MCLTTCRYSAEIEGAPEPLRAVQNILDERIPKSVKRRLLRPLKPRPVPPVCQRKIEKRKAILEELDPLAKNAREGPLQFALNKEVERLHLREYRAAMHDNNRLGGRRCNAIP